MVQWNGNRIVTNLETSFEKVFSCHWIIPSIWWISFISCVHRYTPFFLETSSFLDPKRSNKCRSPLKRTVNPLSILGTCKQVVCFRSAMWPFCNSILASIAVVWKRRDVFKKEIRPSSGDWKLSEKGNTN